MSLGAFVCAEEIYVKIHYSGVLNYEKCHERKIMQMIDEVI